MLSRLVSLIAAKTKEIGLRGYGRLHATLRHTIFAIYSRGLLLSSQ